MQITQIDLISLFAKFNGYSIFSIFYWNVPLLMQLTEWLKVYEEKEEEKQEKEVLKVANWTRLYYMLSHHELEQTEF